MSDQADEAVAEKRGRPSEYNQEMADLICDRLANGESLRKICRDAGIPSQPTIFRWIGANEEFRKQYARARETQADAIADEILNIADEAVDPAKARVQIDARKWLAGKMRPKIYGDKVLQEITGVDGGPVQITRIELVAPVVDSEG